jgi:hypothetical protein
MATRLASRRLNGLNALTSAYDFTEQVFLAARTFSSSMTRLIVFIGRLHDGLIFLQLVQLHWDPVDVN